MSEKDGYLDIHDNGAPIVNSKFSRNQWMKGDGYSRCKDCVDGSALPFISTYNASGGSIGRKCVFDNCNRDLHHMAVIVSHTYNLLHECIPTVANWRDVEDLRMNGGLSYYANCLIDNYVIIPRLRSRMPL